MNTKANGGGVKRQTIETLVYYVIPALATLAIMVGIPLVVAFFFESIPPRDAFVVVLLVYFLLIVTIKSMLAVVDILARYDDN